MTDAQRWAFVIEANEYIEKYSALVRGSIPESEFRQDLCLEIFHKCHKYKENGSLKSFVYWQSLALRARIVRKKRVDEIGIKRFTEEGKEQEFIEDTILHAIPSHVEELIYLNRFMEQFNEEEQVMITSLAHGMNKTETAKVIGKHTVYVWRFVEYLKMVYREENLTDKDRRYKHWEGRTA